MKTKILLAIICLLLSGCSLVTGQAADVLSTDTPAAEATMSTLPNPASVYCEQQGGKSEIRTNPDGSQTGYCIFNDGSECDEWAYYRGECPAVASDTIQADPEAAFCEMLGYTLVDVIAPDGSQLQVCQFGDGSSCNPTALLKGQCVPASQLGSMPEAASIYCQAQGFTSELRTADDGSQRGVCVFPDSRECDEWAYYRGTCDSNTAIAHTSASTGSASDPASSTPIPTAVPIDASFYQGFWTYTHADYGFSIMLPEDWVVDETSSFDPVMNDHVLIFHLKEAQDVSPSLRMAFRTVGDDALLWPTGIGQGEFIPGGTLDVSGRPVQRIYLVCPIGQVQSIWYHGAEDQPNIQIGNLEFSFIYSYTGSYCEGDLSLTGKQQLVGELIIASLKVP
jgi:putative hemolysin